LYCSVKKTKGLL